MNIKKPAEFVGYTFLSYAAKLERCVKRNNTLVAQAIAERNFAEAEEYLARAKDAEAELDNLLKAHLVVKMGGEQIG